MLKPVALPVTPNTADWEKLRAYFVSTEMEPTADNPNGLTPAQAAEQGDARLANAFRSMFPGQRLPLQISQPTQSARTAPLPGGIKTKDGRTWLVISRPEDGRSKFKPQDWIQSGELADMARSYSPDTIHKAPVILPNGGPAHLTGEYAQSVPGQVDALDFDGYFLWALVSENGKGVSKAVANGMSTRSIGSWLSNPEAGGKPYLRHLAITAEPAGTSNLGPMEQFFTRTLSKSLQDAPARMRTINDLPIVERSIDMADDTKEVESIDLEKLTKEITENVTRSVLAAVKNDRKREDNPVPELVRTAVAEALKPVLDKQTALETRFAAAADAANKSAKEARATRVRTSLDDLVRDRRLVPKEREDWEKVLLNDALPEAAIEETLTSLKARTQAQPSRPIEQLKDLPGVTPAMIAEFEPYPGTAGAPVQDMELVLKARAEGAKLFPTDPAKAAQATADYIFRAYGEPTPRRISA